MNMKVEFAIDVKFEDLSLPSKLYKYREYEKPEHIKTITNQEFYFAPPIDFSHHEFNLPSDYESVSKDDFYKNIYKDSLEIFGITDPNRRKAFADYHLSTTEFFDPKFQAMVDKKFRDKRNKEYGIISLSPQRDSCSLWNNFASNHTGFAVGLKPEFMFDHGIVVGSAGHVTYYDKNNPPKIKPFCEDDYERIYNEHLSIFSLPDIFEDEQEYRIGKTIKHSGRFHKVKRECYSEIIIGAFMKDDNKEQLIDLVRTNLGEIDIYQQTVNEKCEVKFDKI